MDVIKALFNWLKKSRFIRKFLDILYETLILIAYLGAIALLHYCMDQLLGPNAMLLGFIPVKYVIDAGHVLAIVNFLLEILKHCINAFRNLLTPPVEV